MKEILFIFVFLGCPDPQLENRTGREWNEHDLRVLNTATQRCPVKYPQSPCLKLFRKVGFQSYHAICGREDGAEEEKVKRTNHSD